MNPQYDWQRPYIAAVLETDRSRIAERIEQAVLVIRERVRVLSNDRGGTPEECIAIEDALRCLEILRKQRVTRSSVRRTNRPSEEAGLGRMAPLQD